MGQGKKSYSPSIGLDKEKGFGESFYMSYLQPSWSTMTKQRMEWFKADLTAAETALTGLPKETPTGGGMQAFKRTQGNTNSGVAGKVATPSVWADKMNPEYLKYIRDTKE